MTATAGLQARRRLARNGETVTLRTITRDTTVNASTGQHEWTTTVESPNLPALIVDTVGSRDANDERDINIKTFSVRVEAGLEISSGQWVEIIEAHDAQLIGVIGTVTDIKRSGRMYTRFTLTTEATP